MTTRAESQPWYRELTRYHITVLVIASLGWLFDTLDQRIFILARASALADLLPVGTSAADQALVSTYMTALFIAGWATGGIVFGVYGDLWGRVRTMATTILLYSLCTGLSALAFGVWDFALYRFLTGLGIGGEFAAGVALVAEVMPNKARPHALGILQMMAIVGTFLGTLASMVVSVSDSYAGIAGWRLLFVVGALPAFLLVFLRSKVRESEAWRAAKRAADAGHTSLGGLRELFTDKRWRRRSIAGMVIGFAGQLGVWGIGTWTPELMRAVLALDLSLTSVDRARVVGLGLMLKDVASLVGIYLLTLVAARFGRLPALAVAFVASLVAAVVTFGTMDKSADIWWMMPLIGLTVWSPLGIYAIYFPELYPTRLRASGTGLCYNVARYLTALGVLGLGQMLLLFEGLGFAMPLKPAAISIASVYVLGLVALRFAPETKDAALPS